MRPLRFVSEHALVEITTRTIHGRLLLTPSPELNDLVLGVIGKAQRTYNMTIHDFVVVSNHAHFNPGEFTTSYDVKLAPLPCLRDMTDDERQSQYRRVVREIDAAASAANQDKRRAPLGVDRILAQDPHHRPQSPDRSPASLAHACDDEKRDEYLHAYRNFVINFRASVDAMAAKARLIIDLFPDWAFLPALPFKPAAQAA